MAEVTDKVVQAQIVVLEEIINKTHTATNTLKLAEAYAWLTNPNNAHGGASSAD